MTVAAINRITRRRFLGWSAIVLAPFAGFRNIESLMPALSSLDLRRKQFAVSLVRAAFPDPGSATRLGITYLRNVPAESDIASLLYALSAESPSLVEMATRNEEVNLMITLHRIIKSDFERGEVVNIGGWIVARTEARLSALASLV